MPSLKRSYLKHPFWNHIKITFLMQILYRKLSFCSSEQCRGFHIWSNDQLSAISRFCVLVSMVGTLTAEVRFLNNYRSFFFSSMVNHFMLSIIHAFWYSMYQTRRTYCMQEILWASSIYDTVDTDTVNRKFNSNSTALIQI